MKKNKKEKKQVGNIEYACPDCGKRSVVKDFCQRCMGMGKPKK